MLEAIRDVKAGRSERICAPGRWVVWREGAGVRWRRLQAAAA